MKLYKVRVNEFLCDGCGDCYSACPINASLKKKSRLNANTAVIIIKHGKAQQGVDGCDGCGVCVETCHKEAIKIQLIE
ncbi:MAG: 4Fe-4S dicluster domain-containing protein [Candidatus Lokiarchaeota archaeon]|nr:4Fe-4S dicluster domain-containing protein [Candidatus Lokiarchaeota archaeon]